MHVTPPQKKASGGPSVTPGGRVGGLRVFSIICEKTIGKHDRGHTRGHTGRGKLEREHDFFYGLVYLAGMRGHFFGHLYSPQNGFGGMAATTGSNFVIYNHRIRPTPRGHILTTPSTSSPVPREDKRVPERATPFQEAGESDIVRCCICIQAYPRGHPVGTSEQAQRRAAAP